MAPVERHEDGVAPGTRRDPDGDDGIAPADLERVMQEVPQGALALAGTAIVLLMLCWLAIYFLVFLPRGSVG